MKISEKLEINDDDRTILLKKNLYNLKQSRRIWNIRFKKFVMSIEFLFISIDNCIFYHFVRRVIIALYVNDILYFERRKSHNIEVIKTLIDQEFKIRNMRKSRSILNVRIITNRAKKTISINQTIYIKSFLRKYEMN